MRLTRTLFISDLHLDDARPAIVARFERFLEADAPGADALYILGDLFEYWVGDDGLALPLPARVAGALARVSRALPIRFMHGNRDFLVDGRFERETGVRLVADPLQVDLYGRRALLMHGDTLCTDDQAYQAFRAQVRDPAWQRSTLGRPLAERVALAHGLRAESEGAKHDKAMEVMDVSRDAVERALRESGCELLIHGHTHRPGRHVHRIDGAERERWVLPDWYHAGGYLEVAPTGVRTITDF